VFRPEFLNRIDEIITFHALTLENIKEIAGIQIEQLNQRLTSRNLKIHLEDNAMEHLAQKGYDPAFGARPLKRVIQQEIENPLSMAILKGEFGEGTTIKFIKNNDGLVLTSEG
jgi:ATP-dependent Clp protease ATP-binding subunit ClpB